MGFPMHSYISRRGGFVYTHLIIVFALVYTYNIYSTIHLYSLCIYCF